MKKSDGKVIDINATCDALGGKTGQLMDTHGLT